MSKHKAKRYADGDLVQDDATGVDEAVAAQSMRTAAEGEGAKDEKAYSGPKAMPSRPVSRTPVAKPAMKKSSASVDDRSKRPSLRGTSGPMDETKMSVSDRLKASRNKSREGTTDTRSVGDRIRSAFGMANGGSASSRADGIASRGKTRGKMC